MADDPIKDIIDREVPALKDGTRIPLADVEWAIRNACARRKFATTVIKPGLMMASYVNSGHSFEVTIPYSDTSYSVRYKSSERMDYDAGRQRIDDSYNEWLAALREHIEADFERALKRLKVAQKQARKAAKVS